MKLFQSKPPATPSDLDVELVETLEAVTECAEQHDPCDGVARKGRKVLKRAKAELGLRD